MFIFPKRSFLTVGIDENFKEKVELFVSVCDQLYPIRRYQMLHFDNECNGEVFLVDSNEIKLTKSLTVRDEYSPYLLIFHKNNGQFLTKFVIGD